MNKNIKLSSLLSLLIVSSEVMAQSQTLDVVNVNDTGVYQRDDISLDSPTNIYKVEKSTHANTEIITKEEIEAQKAKDVFDLLNKVTGLDLTYHGRRSPFTLSMRGSSNITYIVDGAILPPSVSRILYKLPMVAIEEIQVVKSATSLSIAPSINVGASNSGSGVNIGYVIIRTKQPKKTEGILSAFYEKAVSQPSANGQNLYAGTRFGDANSWNGYIGAMLSRFDRKSKDSWFDGSDGESGMLNGGISNGAFSLNFMAYKDKGRFEMQRGVTHDDSLHSAKWYYEPLKTNIFSLDGSMVWNENHVTLFSFAQTEYEQNEHNEDFLDPSVLSTRDYEEKTKNYSLRHNARFGNTKLQIGGQYVDAQGSGSDLFNPYIKYDTTIKGASASVEQTLLGGDLVLDAGYRWDQKTIEDSTAAKSPALAKLNANNGVDLAPASIFTIGGVFDIVDSHSLSARYFYGDQGISGDFTMQTQDSSPLDSEKQKRYELSLDSKFAPYFNSLITYFDTDVENEKRATSNTYFIGAEEYYYYSQVDSRTKGLEMSVKGKVADSTSYKFSWTRILSKETQDYANVSDEVGVIIPKNTFTVLITHTYNDYRFNISGKNASAYTSSKSPMGLSNADLGDYTRIDANIAKDFKLDKYIATAKIYGRNITHDQYATKYTTGYYYDRGRTLGCELSFSF
ncbi:TonB-dependent receptor plug domain-containing protein [Sulfurimonas sp.]|uniref:TonB-dependent receptor plug domain-containing protein n=1 Tax=Sulfurimonas sp. TaxID=2022749 RepID=UPI0035640B5F